MTWDPSDEELEEIFEYIHGTRQSTSDWISGRKVDDIELAPDQRYV